MQPRRPHGQRAPPISTTTWPISPAAPRPAQGLPSRMIPPPTPVPQKTPSSDANSRAAPSSNSASVATLTSLPIATGRAERVRQRAAEREAALPVGQVARARDGARRLVDHAGRADADADEVALDARGARPRASRRPSRRRRPAGRPSVGVGTRASPSTSRSSPTTTAWIFVPPRSIPPSRLMCAP